MSLAAGTRLGPYEILAPLGAGKPSPRIASTQPGVWGSTGHILRSDLAAGKLRLLDPAASDWRDLSGDPGGEGEGPIYPSWLPDGRRFVVVWGSPAEERAAIYLGGIDGRPWRRLADLDMERESTNIVYAAGHVLLGREQMIVARRLDEDRDILSTEAVVLAGPVNYTHGEALVSRFQTPHSCTNPVPRIRSRGSSGTIAAEPACRRSATMPRTRTSSCHQTGPSSRWGSSILSRARATCGSST